MFTPPLIYYYFSIDIMIKVWVNISDGFIQFSKYKNEMKLFFFMFEV